MTAEEPDKEVSLIPEAFYDLIAYVVPSALFVVALLRLYPDLATTFTSPTKSIIFDFLSAVLGLGSLYLLGQVTTSISYVLLGVPLLWLSKDRESIDDLWSVKILEIKAYGSAGVSLEIMKRYARWIASRNVTVIAIVVVGGSIFHADFVLVRISTTIALLAAFVALIQTRQLVASMRTAHRIASSEK
ncbi:MAG: hypothetical protein ACKO3V_16275 [Pirellula sp.]